MKALFLAAVLAFVGTSASAQSPAQKEFLRLLQDDSPQGSGPVIDIEEVAKQGFDARLIVEGIAVKIRFAGLPCPKITHLQGIERSAEAYVTRYICASDDGKSQWSIRSTIPRGEPIRPPRFEKW
jgi:hypothetical protein